MTSLPPPPFDEMCHARLSLAECCAQHVPAGTFPLCIFKYGGQRRYVQSVYRPCAEQPKISPVSLCPAGACFVCVHLPVWFAVAV